MHAHPECTYSTLSVSEENASSLRMTHATLPVHYLSRRPRSNGFSSNSRAVDGYGVYDEGCTASMKQSVAVLRHIHSRLPPRWWSHLRLVIGQPWHFTGSQNRYRERSSRVPRGL